jgi:Tol biopolymer transport system component
VLVRRLLLIAALLPVAVSPTAQATTPGANGRIVFVRQVDWNTELYSMNPDGSAERRLTWTLFENEATPDWSPDGSRIVFARTSSNDGSWLWVMNADGSDQRQLASIPGTEPRWSPDGSKIVFASTALSAGWRLWLVNPDGSGLHRLGNVSGTEPSWSPDGTRIAYDDGSGISVIGSDGSDPQAVTAINTYSLSWSPDGTRLAFSYSGHLFTVDVDGSNQHQLTSGSDSEWSPAWSPDGTRIAFHRTLAGTFRNDIWTIAADGSDESRLTTNEDGLSELSWGPAQIVPEPTPPQQPQIDIGAPRSDGYLPGPITAWYICASAVSTIVSCDGDVPSGGQFTAISAGTHTFTVRATDAEGRTAAKSVSFQIPDITPPTITPRVPADGAVYDQGSFVTVDYGCDDPNGDGDFVCVSNPPNGAFLDTGQVGLHTFHVAAFDDAGHSSAVNVTYRVAGPPAVALTAPTEGAVYALNADARVAYSCADQSGSGLASCTGDQPSGAAVDTSTPGSHTFTVTAVDNRGRRTTKTVNYLVVGPPTISISSPADGSTYLIGANIPVDYHCTSTVPQLNALTCNGPSAVDTSTVGPKTFTVSATDAAGVSASKTSSYTVVWPFTGFDSPVSASGAVDAKAGEPVPLKFSLGGDRGTGIVAGVTWQTISCAGGGGTGATTAGTGSLSYSASSGRYTQLLNTDKSWKGTCRVLTLRLADTTTHQVNVHFVN